MKYKGVELVPITEWDGKYRDVLYWFESSKEAFKGVVINKKERGWEVVCLGDDYMNGEVFYADYIAEIPQTKTRPMTAREVFDKCRELGCFFFIWNWENDAEPITYFDFENNKIVVGKGDPDINKEDIDFYIRGNCTFGDGSLLTVEVME